MSNERPNCKKSNTIFFNFYFKDKMTQKRVSVKGTHYGHQVEVDSVQDQAGLSEAQEWKPAWWQLIRQQSLGPGLALMKATESFRRRLRLERQDLKWHSPLRDEPKH